MVVPPRKVPFALKDRLKKELDRMENMGIIEKVEKSTDWVNALVLVEKPNGKLRVCLDPRPLNQAIKRHHYRLPTTEEIISQMSGARFFSKLDASNGYWQIAVDDFTSDLLTFGTVFGRYKFKRMPYGIHSASEIFQLEISKIIAGCDGAANSQDDIIVWGETKEIHDERLKKVLDKIRDNGLKLNHAKCIFGATELTFLGHIMSADGVKPDPRKIEAITKMPLPTSPAELQRFLGMVNYLGKFIPNLSDETAPLRALLKKGTEFLMQKPQIDAFEKLKRQISSAPLLQFYDPNLPTRIRTDSSSVGLGAMLEQRIDDSWHPIAFASRALEKSEQNYAQIERETLSVVFGCERFHEYLYGREFIVHNDHQPLKAVFSKSIVQCPPRIQRFFLRLQKYDFSFEYAPGKTMKVADALSRASLPGKPEIAPEDIAHHVHSIINQLPVSQSKLSQLQRETAIDPVLQTLKQYTVNGWPSDDIIDMSVKPFYSQRHEIVYNHDLLLKGQQIIVPKSMRPEIRTLLHQGHQGIEKCKSRARQAVYWPGINHELTVLVSQCATCTNHRNRQQKETLIPHDVPDQPWAKVGTDLFSLHGRDYLIVVDYHSKFFEVAHIEKPAEAPAVIREMKKIFSRHGIPQTVFSDNGPQYTAAAFKRFSREWDFQHDTSSPHFPQSNGLVERTIQTVKKSLKKAEESRSDVYLSMLVLNTTPNSDGHSPAYKLYQRNPRTTLPSVSTQPPCPLSPKRKLKQSYDQHARNLPTLLPGTTVRVRTDKDTDWSKKGKVVEKCSEPRSYRILNQQGNVVRRNRRHLLPTKETFKVENDDNYDDLKLSSKPSTSNQPDLQSSRNNPIVTSRSGRQIKKPSRYED